MGERDAALNDINLNTPVPSLKTKDTPHDNFLETADMNGENCAANSFSGPIGSEYASEASKYTSVIEGFLKCPSLNKFETVSESLTRLYRAYMWKHHFKKVRELTKRNMLAVIKLLEIGETNLAARGVMLVFNETNPHQINTLDQLLLADFTSCNNYYLLALKLLALQIIIKGRTHDAHCETILTVFAKDSRYLLKGGKTKISSMSKVLLNFFSLLPKYKALFGLKFLQYVRQFDLDYKSFIKNMSLPQFQTLIQKWAKTSISDIEEFLNLYYVSYSRHFATADKLMLRDIVEHKTVNRIKALPGLFNSLSIHQWNSHLKTLSSMSNNEQNSLVEFVEVKIHEKACSVPKVASLVLNFMQFANARFVPASSHFWRLFDKLTVFLNSNLETIAMHVLKELMESMSEFCLNNMELKRLLNIANVAYNAFIIHKMEVFLMEAARFDRLSQTMTEGLDLNLSKLEKFMSCVSNNYRVELFNSLFNVFTCFRYDTLAPLLEMVGKFSKCYKLLRLPSLHCLNGASELMICLLSTSQSLDLEAIPHWSPLCQMMYYSHEKSRKGNDTHVSNKKDELDPLKLYEPLVRTAYYLGLEREQEACLRLPKIADVYIEKWVKRPISSDEDISAFEISLIQVLFGALKFNKFYRKVISLAEALLSSNKSYFEKCAEFSQGQLVFAYAGLQMKKNTLESIRKLRFMSHSPVITDMNVNEASDFVEVRLLSFEEHKDYTAFNKFFNQDLPKSRREMLDVGNVTKMPTKSYLRVLLLNIKILNTASTLQLHNNNMKAALIESKRSLKLCQTLLKKVSKLDQQVKWELLTCLGKSFTDIIKIYTQVGISKDCEFYVTEYLRFACSINIPILVHDCLHVSLNYYKLTGQSGLIHTLLKKANSMFDKLDGSENIEALSKFLLNNNEGEKLLNSLNLFFKDQTTETLLYDYWKLQLGETLSYSHADPLFNKINDINKGKKLYAKIARQMDTDPFFGSMKESVTAIPSCALPAQQSKVLHPGKNEFDTPVKRKLFPFASTNSPRPSSLTPRGKSLKQNFDRARTVNDLKIVINLIEALDLKGMKNFEIRDASDLYSLSLSLMSSITVSKVSAIVLDQKLALSDIPKFLPLHFDKVFTSLGNEIYASFAPNVIETESLSINAEIQNLLESQSILFSTCQEAFNIITIDVCGITGDLMLSKLESNKNPICLRLPVSRHSSRDVDETPFKFEDAIRELKCIIEESNRSTSIEVTSKINTKEERKEWWQHRYGLDSRLKTLLTKIERSWFCGFKTFFSQCLVEQKYLDSFRIKFEEILQQTLPTRKQFGSPDHFLRIDDVILELLLKLNPTDKDFMELMEDVIFFVFDLLLFHGEENAYDEVDTNLLHVQLEELIKDYHKEVTSPNILSHTFLVVCSAGHLIPWESLSFLADTSVSRIPCIQSLADILQKRQLPLSPTIDLNEKMSMILNPDGDLIRTQENFKGVFEQWKDAVPHSSLLVGKKPEEAQLVDMLICSKVFIYVGHGGGEQYVRLKKIKELDSAAPSFLLGCSSAYMDSRGKLEPSGVIYSYLLGGSSMVVGNLWDVTDKDIDKFSGAMFGELGLMGEGKEGKTVSQAVSLARNSCHLKYLNGAAPVVYGLPLKFRR
ncbi:LANO_0F09670g1_1 [Lachancea nothofagi CBS 11611]|uniref:separase n=1 Tax=Lachancea nothofagi CBS 11611 TaxID=1266666 RepID=A0A1G4KA00_9SACH|nr:LANO_0F09670g1_1 [Lachancea nothofagi CBS 11611]